MDSSGNLEEGKLEKASPGEGVRGIAREGLGVIVKDIKTP